MGTFKVSITAVGNHGCQREKKGSDVIDGCGQPSCTDCMTRDFVSKLKAAGTVSEAYIHHWPGSAAKPDGSAGDVVDNLLTQRRLGSF